MPKSPLTITLDTSRLNRAVEAFARVHGPAATDRLVRRLSFGVGGRIVRALNGQEGNPKRIDTGRYRAAWAMGTADATGMSLSAPSSASEASDGMGSRSGSGLNATITVTNNVDYGPYVEYGTESMSAGLHVQDAIRKEGAKAADVIEAEFARAWRA